jgi:hypothetical protein
LSTDNTTAVCLHYYVFSVNYLSTTAQPQTPAHQPCRAAAPLRLQLHTLQHNNQRPAMTHKQCDNTDCPTVRIIQQRTQAACGYSPAGNPRSSHPCLWTRVTPVPSVARAITTSSRSAAWGRCTTGSVGSCTRTRPVGCACSGVTQHMTHHKGQGCSEGGQIRMQKGAR